MTGPLFKKIIRLVGKGIGDFNLIEHGDRILVALSGGKDSWTLLHALLHLQRKAPIRYEVHVATIHPGPKGFDTAALEARLRSDGIPYTVIQGNIVDVVNENLTPGTNPCSFCARLRRGILYSFAASEGWNKIALGHHLDDFVETLILNQVFSGTIKGMSPHLIADDGRNRVIRPLVYVEEWMTRQAAAEMGVPILGCFCAYQGMSGTRRGWVKSLLATMEKEIPHVRTNLLAAMARVDHRHLLHPVRRGRKADDQI
ncbi:MAG: ATP-binding protein [Pseudomonadota bacterium]